MSIKIVTDSASDITQAEAQSLGITVLPSTVIFGDEEYLDGVTLSHREFYEKLIETDVLPTTSQIPLVEFERVFRELTADGSDVLCITISSKLSGAFGGASVAAQNVGERVTVVDSENAALGERIFVMRALELVQSGMSVKEVEAQLISERSDIHLIAMLDTLEYLKKGGRISAMTAFAGGILAIKPVIEVRDGEVQLLGKARGSRAANNRLNEMVAAAGGIDFSRPLCLSYSGLSDGLLKKYIADSESLYKGMTDSLPISTLGSTIGVHVGPGAIGLAFFAAEKGE
ncbi:MAG: DegV family protein [Oscillospiraceae bacterium]|nr:DegV family protein [Oscillospiraceae bacterium]